MSDSQLHDSSAFERLLAIYDADGGLVGGVRYVVGHRLGSAACALRDMTHSPMLDPRALTGFQGSVATFREGLQHALATDASSTT